MVDFARCMNQPPRPPPRVPRLVVSVTGHRPHKLHSFDPTPQRPGDGYDWSNPLRRRVRVEVETATRRLVDAARSQKSEDRGTSLLQRGELDRVAWKPGVNLDDLDVVCLTGVAIGVDQDASGVWRRMGLLYVAVVPFEGQESRWLEESQHVYRKVLDAAAGVVVTSPQRPVDRDDASAMLLRRNDFLLCADELIAVWDGSGGGTASTVRSWRRCGRREVLVDLDDLRQHC